MRPFPITRTYKFWWLSKTANYQWLTWILECYKNGIRVYWSLLSQGKSHLFPLKGRKRQYFQLYRFQKDEIWELNWAWKYKRNNFIFMNLSNIFNEFRNNCFMILSNILMILSDYLLCDFDSSKEIIPKMLKLRFR